ncbi:MAG: glycosyltransferase [Pseudomonadota bacterium]
MIAVQKRHDDIAELYRAYAEALRRCNDRFEFIFVLDGDHPEVRAQLEQLRREGEPIQLIRFTRAFGQSVALTVGFEHSEGELVLTLPAFYQIDPETLPAFIGSLDDADMLQGRRWPRTDSALNRAGTVLLHRLIRLVTGHTFRDVGCSLRLMRRQVAREVMIYGDQHTFLPVLASNRGFRVREVSVQQSKKDPYVRYYQPSEYLRRLLSILTIFFLGRFTKAPLRFFGVCGTLLILLGVLLIGIVVFERLFSGVPAGDRPMLLFGVVNLVLGAQVFALGLIGELIIFTHGRHLKEYSIAEVEGVGLSERPSAAPDVPDRVSVASQGGGDKQ